MDFRVFESTPGISVIVRPDQPDYTTIAASDDFIRLTSSPRKDIIGKKFFDLFPQNPEEQHSSSAQNLKVSFEYVLRSKLTHQIPFQRYDLITNGVFVQKYWKIKNIPVLGNNGQIEFIIHHRTEIAEPNHPGNHVALSDDLQKAYNVFLNTPVIIGILKGDDYIIELANDGLLEVWNRSTEVIGKPLLEAIPELEPQGFISLLEQVRTTGEPYYAYEFPITLKRNGRDEVVYFDFVYKPVYSGNNDKKASGIISVGHDVTSQVTARLKVQQSEAKYRSLFDSMDQGFCILEIAFDKLNNASDYRFLEVNPAFEKITGLTGATGRTVRELIPKIEGHWFEIYGKVALTGEPVRFMQGSDAMGQWFDVYAFPIGERAKYQVALLFTDITESKKAETTLRESEERFRYLADESPMFVFLIDSGPLAPVSYWNKTWLEYTGQTFPEAIGRSWNGIIHPDDVQTVMENYTPAFVDQKSYFIPAVRVRRQDGEYRWHAFKGSPRYLPNGDFNGYVGVGFDIHEQKLNEELIKQSEFDLQMKVAQRTAELEKTVEELKRSNENLEEFAYAASHDLKEPMRKILIFSTRLKDHLQDKMTADDEFFFDRILHATQRMKTLIDDLLMYSHVSRGAIMDEAVSLDKKLKLVLEDLELEIEEKSATIIVDPLPVITGHRRQLQQLFQNLVGNAIKYSRPEKPPVVHITHRVVIGKDLNEMPVVIPDPDQHFHLIEVADNGIGFPQQDAERIFKVFTRLHNNAHYKGTGVGLSIARKVVENHGGYIWAESQPEEGSIFKVLLPAAN